MSTVRRRGAAAALANREQYIRVLQEALPEMGPRSIKHGPLQQTERRRLQDAVQSGELTLPTDWIAGATRVLHLSCADIVTPQVLSRQDYFLCALIHPTYIQPARGGARSRAAALALRRAVAMPLETSLSGAAVLQLLREVREAHARSLPLQERRWGEEEAGEWPGSPMGASQNRGASRAGTVSSSAQLLTEQLPKAITATHLVEVPRVAGLDRFLLYDAAAFPATETHEGLPNEVGLAAVTSLCGAIDLCEGSQAVAAFLDRVLPRVVGKAVPTMASTS